MHNIRFVRPNLWSNTSVDSCRGSGVHVAVLLVTREYLIRTSMLSTPRNRLWWTLSMLLFVCVTVSLALQVCWSMGVERILEGSGSGLNVARVLLLVCRSVPVQFSRIIASPVGS